MSELTIRPTSTSSGAAVTRATPVANRASASRRARRVSWLDGWRRRLDDTLEKALETYAAACLGLGGTELAGAERAARRLLEHSPLRETAYGTLMQTLAARGQVPDALHVYKQARTVLRNKLGIPPGPALARLHTRLLEGTSEPRGKGVSALSAARSLRASARARGVPRVS